MNINVNSLTQETINLFGYPQKYDEAISRASSPAKSINIEVKSPIIAIEYMGEFAVGYNKTFHKFECTDDLGDDNCLIEFSVLDKELNVLDEA